MRSEEAAGRKKTELEENTKSNAIFLTSMIRKLFQYGICGLQPFLVLLSFI
jgi:hypothetical protein